jgi:Fe-S cluster assembly iron-binding protein IscA
MKIDFTPAAEKFIRRLLKFDGGPGYGLSLYVSPGGCSGMSAEFSVKACSSRPAVAPECRLNSASSQLLQKASRSISMAT